MKRQFSRISRTQGTIAFAGLLALFAMGASAAALVPVTNVWTGAGGDLKWSNMSNWEALGGGSPHAIGENIYWDFSALEANATVVADYSGNIIVCGLGFGANKGRVTLSSSSSSCRVAFRKYSNDPYFSTYIDVPSGTTLDLAIAHNDTWTQWGLFLRGGGAVILSGAAFQTATTQQIHVQDVDFTLASTLNHATISGQIKANDLLAIYLESNDSVFRIERDFTLSRILANNPNTSPKIYRNGHTLTALWVNGGGSFYGQFMDAGKIVFASGYQMQFGGSLGAGVDELELDVRGVRLEASTPVEGLALTTSGAGKFVPNADMTLSSITNATAESGVEIPSGRTLTIAGKPGREQYLPGSFTGGGNLEFTSAEPGGGCLLTGVGSYTGTTAVRSGATVRTRRPKAADGLLCYLNFEADEDALDIWDANVDSLIKFSRWGAAWTCASISKTGGCGGGHCLRFNSDNDEAIQNDGYEPVPSKLKYGMTNDHSIVLYLKPSPRTMNLEDESIRPDNVMEIFYNRTWENYRTAWVYFNGTNEIVFAGFVGPLNNHRLPLDGVADFFDGDYHQLAWTYSTNSMTFHFYVDGVERTKWTRGSQYHYGEGGAILGARTATAAGREQTFDGDMDNVQFWGRELSAEEIAEDWSRRGNLAGEEIPGTAKPVAHWKFDDPADIGKDSSGNGFHLETVGSGLAVVDSSTAPGVNGKAVHIKSQSYLKLSSLPAQLMYTTNAFTVIVRTIPVNGSSSGAAFEVTDGTTSLKTTYASWAPNGWPVYAYVGLGGDLFYGVAGAYGMVAHYSGTFQPAQWDTIGIRYAPEIRTWGNKYYFTAWHHGSKETSTWSSDSKIMAFDDTCSLYIGYDPAKSAYANCYVDEVRIYDRALHPREISEISRELGSGGGGYVLPDNGVVTVDGGGTLSLGASQRFSTISGSGTLDLFAADLSLSGASTFAGRVTGGGTIKVPADGGLALTGDCGGYTGYVRTSGGKVSAGESFTNATVFVEEGTVISTDVDGTGMPFVSAPCKVVLPASGTVEISNMSSGRRSLTLVSGASVEAADGFDGWTVSPDRVKDCKFRLRQTGGDVVLDVLPAGLAIVFK